jgi:hypothetical protein
MSGDTAVMVQELSGGQPLVAARTRSGFNFQYLGGVLTAPTVFFAGQPDTATPYALYSVPRLGGTGHRVAELGRRVVQSRADGRAPS